MKTLNDVLLAEGLHLDQVAREGEHSLEIQLPFLQRVWQTPFELIPVMVRTYDEGKITAFASALAQTLKKQDALIIASSDLSHFQSLEVAQQLDAETLRRIRARDAQQVLAGAKDESAPACGAAGIAVMLETTQKTGRRQSPNSELQHLSGRHRGYLIRCRIRRRCGLESSVKRVRGNAMLRKDCRPCSRCSGSV